MEQFELSEILNFTKLNNCQVTLHDNPTSKDNLLKEYSIS
jgi:hypothetical protein